MGVGIGRFRCRQRGAEETINLGNGPISVSLSAGSTRAEGKVHADRRAESPSYQRRWVLHLESCWDSKGPYSIPSSPQIWGATELAAQTAQPLSTEQAEVASPRSVSTPAKR